MNLKKNISSSMEDYLETIYLFETKKQQARVVEIAKHLKVKKASVTEALQNLARENLVNYVPYNPITLTEQGKKAAEAILRKHNIVKEFFRDIFNLSEEEASDTACKIEHVISDKLASRFELLRDNLFKLNADNKFIEKLHKSF